MHGDVVPRAEFRQQNVVDAVVALFAAGEDLKHELLFDARLITGERPFARGVRIVFELFAHRLLDVRGDVVRDEQIEVCGERAFMASREVDGKRQDLLLPFGEQGDERRGTAARLQFTAQKVGHGDALPDVAGERSGKFFVGHGGIILLGRGARAGDVGIPKLPVQLGNDVFPLLFGILSRIHADVLGEFFLKQPVEIDEFLHMRLTS